MKNYVITIARGFGSGGRDIGQRLSERLGIPVYDREILTKASEESGINEALFAQTDEKIRQRGIARALKSIPREGVLEPEDRNFTSDNNLFAIQSEIIKALCDTESCIIIGRCGDYVLRHRKNVLSIYVDAPRQTCVESIMEKMSVSEREANRLIEVTDSYRADYYKYYTGGRDWVNPTNYHMFLNSDKLGREACVDLIEAAVKLKFGE